MTDQDARFREDFSRLEEASHRYESEEIGAKEFKAVSTSFGGYLQRDNLHMLRIRVPGGRLTPDHARAIVDACDYYGLDRLKITTGEALQVHDLAPHAARRLVLRLLDAGIVTFGAGGDNPNNISAPPLTGLGTASRMDVMPYAQAVETCFLNFVGVSPLPRKFKVGFADSVADETHVTLKDLGFMANDDGTFQVWIAGGMGVKPRLGIEAAESVSPDKVLYYARAMLELFSERGDRDNRFKARSRFLQDSMGVDNLLEDYCGRAGLARGPAAPGRSFCRALPPGGRIRDGGAPARAGRAHRQVGGGGAAAHARRRPLCGQPGGIRGGGRARGDARWGGLAARGIGDLRGSSPLRYRCGGLPGALAPDSRRGA